MSLHFAHMIAHFFVGVGTHTTITPAAVPIPAGPHMSAQTLLGLTINAKYAPRVLGMGGIPLCGRGNDSGFIIPHFDLSGTWALIPVVVALGGSKIMFGSSKTKILLQTGSSTDVGCVLIPYSPVGSNQACNDPCNYPSDLVISPNTVMVGMTWGDIVGGFADIAFDVALSYLLAAGGGNIAGRLQARLYRHGSAALMLRMANNPILTQVFEQGVGKVLTTIFGKGSSATQGGANTLAGGDIIHDGWGSVGDLIGGDDGPANDPRVHRTSDSLTTDPNVMVLP